jgi:hypothetical protein
MAALKILDLALGAAEDTKETADTEGIKRIAGAEAQTL